MENRKINKTQNKGRCETRRREILRAHQKGKGTELGKVRARKTILAAGLGVFPPGSEVAKAEKR